VSLVVLVQRVPHRVGLNVGHAQTLFMQAVSGAAQVMPQPPQLAALLVVLTQVPLHTVGAFVGHAQALFWQV
jgi:hypothetical protein